MIQESLQWLYKLSLAGMIQRSGTLFPLIESIHVVALATVVGSIVFIDLRLIGLASRGRPISVLAAAVLPLTWGAFALAVLSGATLFISNALVYYGNSAFRLKMALILLAGVNMAVFHATAYRSIGQWDRSPRPPLAAQAAGIISILLWVGAIACGRWIGFTVE